MWSPINSLKWCYKSQWLGQKTTRLKMKECETVELQRREVKSLIDLFEWLLISAWGWLLKDTLAAIGFKKILKGGTHHSQTLWKEIQHKHIVE